MKGTAETADEKYALLHGGLIDSLLKKGGVANLGCEKTNRKVLAFIALTFLPLLGLCLAQNVAFGPGLKIPFLLDVAEITRFLFVGPLLLIAEKIVEPWLTEVIKYARNRIIEKPDVEKFDKAIDIAAQWRSSSGAEMIVLLGTFVWQAVDVLGHNSTMTCSSWQTVPLSSQPSYAWFYYAFFAKPLYRFLWLRWLWRYCIWVALLVRMSFLSLNLRATHPDRLGGLEFIIAGHSKFAVLAFAFGMQAASVLADQIIFEGKTLMSFRYDLIGFVLLVSAIFLTPLLVFSLKLAQEKRLAIFQYGALADDYVAEFHTKWIKHNDKKENLLGTSDIQSLADLSNSFNVVREMRTCLISKNNISTFALATLLPFSPLLLTVYPFDELLNHLLKSLM